MAARYRYKATGRDLAAAEKLIDNVTESLGQWKPSDKTPIEEHWVGVLREYFAMNRPARVAQAAA